MTDNHSITHDAFGITWTLTYSRNISDEDLLRYGFPSCPLRQITDVYVRTGDYGREPVVISRVSYSGGFYFRTRPYMVSDSTRGHVWSRFEESDRYLDSGDLSRGWEHSWAKMTDAARAKVGEEFAPIVDKFLDDEDAVRTYWQQSLATVAGYRRDEAQRALNLANQYAALAVTIGAPARTFSIKEN